MGDLITYNLLLPTTNGYVDFTFSQDQDTVLRLFLWRKRDGVQNKKLIWENQQPTNGIVAARAKISETKNDEFKLVFQAEVAAKYQFQFRTYLTQVVIDKVQISAS